MSSHYSKVNNRTQATIVPPVWPNYFSESHPEHTVYKLLSRLPTNYTVYYSKKFKGAQQAKEECEVDFLIFDGHKNLICLEVKGGIIKYDGTYSQWYQNDKPLNTAPDRQASAARAAVIEFLGPLGRDINIDWALCFPNCCLPQHAGSIPEVPRQLIIDSNDLQDFDAAISRIEKYFEQHHGRSGTSTHNAKELAIKLQRSMQFVTKIGHRIARDSNMIAEATEEQMDVLYDLELNNRVLVEGYAGTGKTLIAQEYAKRLEQDGKRVLLLFFNRMIANHVRYSFDRESTIECQTFHQFARQTIEKVDPTWWDNQDRKLSNFWDEVIPLQLMEVLSNPNLSEYKFDAIIVDEGQDFKSDWFETLDELLVTPESKFIVFFDSNQDLFNRWKEVPWATTATRKLLTRNCRNTRKIVSYLQEKLPSKMRPFDKSPEGSTVAERSYTSADEACALLKADIEKLLSEDVNPGQIVILSNAETWSKSDFSGLTSVRRHKLEWARKINPRSRSIHISTINQFKGMEADVILLTDIPKNEEFVQRLYTQVTRAIAHVIVYYKPT